MADVRAVKSGNWSDTTVWNTGALPTSSDDVWANTYTVTIDTSPTVLSIRTGSTTNVTAGGSFVPNNGITLTATGAGVVAGTTSCFSSSLTTGQSCTIVGNCTGGTSTSSNGANNTSAGTLNITGNCTGGTTASTNGASNTSTGTLNITGNCTGSGNSSSNGASNTSTGTLNITGNCTGGTISTGNGANNTSTGTLTHVGTAQASALASAIGTGAAGQVTILTGPLISTSTTEGSAAASGVNPCVALRWFPADTALSTFTYTMRGATVSGSPSSRPARVLALPEATANAYPSASNVRSGTVYGVGNAFTGTCAVPGASSVLSGVPVDATTGTVTITAADIRSAVGLASANLDTQLSGKPTAAQIRTELTTELGRIDATISSRSTYAGADTSGTTTLLSRLTSTRAGYLDNLSTAPPSAVDIATAVWAAATRTLTAAIDQSSTIASAVWAVATRTITGGIVDTLTNAPDVPTEAEIATAVRSELSTELGRIDATVSSRLAPGGTLARVTLTDTATTLTNAPTVPTPEEIAAEVRTELTPELERVGNCATVETTGDQLAAFDG